MKNKNIIIGLLLSSLILSCENPTQKILEDDDPPKTYYGIRIDNQSSLDTLYVEWHERIPNEVKNYSEDLNFDKESVAIKSEHLLKWDKNDSLYATEIYISTWKTLYLGGFDAHGFYQPDMTEDQLISLLPEIKLFVKRNNQKVLILGNDFFHKLENWIQYESLPAGKNKIPERTQNRLRMYITDEMLK